MSEKPVECSIRVGSQHLLGSYVNAFRVVPGVDEDCFLDFLLYSAVEDVAVLVDCVHIHVDLLPEIRETLGEVLTDFAEAVKEVEGVNGNTVPLN